jgi:hypothetical protein
MSYGTATNSVDRFIKPRRSHKDLANRLKTIEDEILVLRAEMGTHQSEVNNLDESNPGAEEFVENSNHAHIPPGDQVHHQHGGALDSEDEIEVYDYRHGVHMRNNDYERESMEQRQGRHDPETPEHE